MSMEFHPIGLSVFVFLVAIVVLPFSPIHAQFSDDNIFLKGIPKFSFATDDFLKRLAPDVDFSYRLQVIGEDFREFLTFNPVEKAQLKLEHARTQQDKINDLDSRGLAIPLEIEERRIQKINEATVLLNQNERAVKNDSGIFDDFQLLKEMGELNDIRILYSQLPKVVNADEETKTRFSEKVNSLDSWKNNCTGEFNVDDMKPLREAVEKLEKQCPKLVDLQEKFGYDRLKMLVTGRI